MSDKCNYFKELIKDDLAGELSRELQAELHEHLESCQACSREKDELARVFEMMDRVEDRPVPGHFFVYEQPRMSLLQMLKNLAPASRWAAAAVSAAFICMFGFVLMNVHIQYRDSSLLVAFGNPGSLQAEQFLQEKINNAVNDARAEDRVMISRLLEVQNQQVNAAFRNLNQKVDVGFNQLENRFADTVESSNRRLKNQMDLNILQYGEMMKAQQQTDLLKINNRLDQIVLEGRRRDTRNQTVLTTLAQYGITGSRSRGAIYD